MSYAHIASAHREGPTSANRTEPEPDVVISATKPVLTVPEAADLLGISRSLAYELVARHKLPAVRLGRRILVPQRAIEDLLASACAARTAE
jgi:excisionase family DNA binding protein